MTRPLRVAIVGGGAAGTLVAIRLLELARKRSQWLDITVFEVRARLGHGVAYSTPEPRHRVNAAAHALSADPDDPGAFERWLEAEANDVDELRFPPRAYYGRYLADTLDARAKAAAPYGSLTHDRQRVVALTERGQQTGLRLRTESGSCHAAEAVVLAIGQFPPACDRVNADLRDHPRLIEDPWRDATTLDRARYLLADGETALLVGSGLTMVDVAMSLDRPGVSLLAVSRSGLLPHAHLNVPGPAMPTPPIEPTADLSALRRAVLAHISRARRATGDWRPGIDSLRQMTAQLWRELPVERRQAFVAEYARLWDVHRHRMSPATDAWLRAAVTADRLKIRRAAVSCLASPSRTQGRSAGIDVRLSDGVELHVGLVVNCTAPLLDFTRAAGPLVGDLLRSGTARPGPLGTGLATQPDGRIIPKPAGQPVTACWTLGAPRKGSLWESTAIPEIRAQASEIANAIVAESRSSGA